MKKLIKCGILHRHMVNLHSGTAICTSHITKNKDIGYVNMYRERGLESNIRNSKRHTRIYASERVYTPLPENYEIIPVYIVPRIYFFKIF